MGYPVLYACEFACTAASAFMVYLVLRRFMRDRLNTGAPSAALTAAFAIWK